MNMSRVSVVARILPILAWAMCVLGSLLLAGCLSPDGRVAGSSTEAGNAGGKLSLRDGSPAAGVSVALVARTYLPDTGAAIGQGDLAGTYYRTRTGQDGRFSFKDVAPGSYRVMAVDPAGGVMADSVSVQAGNDTTLIDEVLKPLGGISGVAKIVGSAARTNVWVRPKATLQTPPRADDAGAFRLDSLPEGEYELVPQCFTCRVPTEAYRVSVQAGKTTVLDDTLKLYPEYFFGFPDSGDLTIRAAWMPVSIGGKIHRGEESKVLPSSVEWTWNGRAFAGLNVTGPDGISDTKVVVDSTTFAGAASGRLRLALHYPDTTLTREWRVVLDASERIWPLSAVQADGAVRIPGPANRTMWRFHVTASRPLDPAAAAFWGLQGGLAGMDGPADLPEWIDLGADEAEMALLGPLDASRFTFFLLPDRAMGGRLFRPRRDERLEDIPEIGFLQRARFGFPDSMVPSLLPGGLILDRHRGSRIVQRYRVDSAGGVEELSGELALGDPKPGQPAGAGEDPILFYRSGSAADGYSWDKPMRGAVKALAVTRDGYAIRLDGARISLRLTEAELDSLRRLLEPLSQDPPALADTGIPALTGTLEYVLAGKRGFIKTSGSGDEAGTFMAGLKAWMSRNGLDEAARFPLAGGASAYLGFEEDSAGHLRYTGDTLAVERSDSAGGALVREYLTSGSPGRDRDSAVYAYYLKVEGDSLVAESETGIASRLYGRLDGHQGLFPLIGLKTVSPDSRNGIPLLTGSEGGGNTLSGRLDGDLVILGRTVRAPAVFLDGRPILVNRQGQGFLYTSQEGLEMAWRFGGSIGTVKGWDKR
ncbi:MAG: hypothetical protein JWP91_85 [Fibrobacteres bacterium]|nr:hypothetical protein [Fibrobacterota bacterium]